MAVSAVLAVLLASALAGAAAGGDIVHQDDQAPKIPGCSNDFVLVSPSPLLLSARLSSSVRIHAFTSKFRFPRQLSCSSVNYYLGHTLIGFVSQTNYRLVGN
jgi:hypothetical protein